MQKLLLRTLLAFLVLWSSRAAYADSFTFTTLPGGGAVSGSAGSTIGWGYSITNSSLSKWLVTTNISADPFLDAIPVVLFDFPILAPGATATLAFNAALGAGLYQLTWDTTAPSAFLNSGKFLLSAEFWDADPFAGGSFLETAADQQTAYSATVSGGVSNVPEPDALLLVGAACAMIALKKTIGRRKQSV